jgi:hypothetical protein
LVVAAAILGGVVLAALGRAGEMASFAGDTAPLELDEVSATDVALLRPPMSLWGYNAQATEEALRVIARSVTARDVEIATLRRELAELQDRQDGARAAGAAERPPAPANASGPANAGHPANASGPANAGHPANASGPANAGHPANASGPANSAGPVSAASPAGPLAGQPRRADPPAPPAGEEHRADPPWLPAWQRPPGPGSDE